MQYFCRSFESVLSFERLVFALFLLKNVENMQIFSRSWCPFDIKLRQPQQNWVHWKENFMTFQKTGYNGTGITRLFSVHKVFFLEVISWTYVSICYASIFASVWNKFNCWETCFCPIFVEKCEKKCKFSHGYDVILISNYANLSKICFVRKKILWPFRKYLYVYSFGKNTSRVWGFLWDTHFQLKCSGTQGTERGHGAWHSRV